jgi:hypothetical protein
MRVGAAIGTHQSGGRFDDAERVVIPAVLAWRAFGFIADDEFLAVGNLAHSGLRKSREHKSDGKK